MRSQQTRSLRPHAIGPMAAGLVLLAAFTILPGTAHAQRESTDSIGGITFDPPRKATIRTKSRRLDRGDLIGVSATMVHLRIANGKEYHYDLDDIRSVATVDGEFHFTPATDSYSDAVSRANSLEGVSKSGGGGSSSSGGMAFAAPPPPPMPKVYDSPAKYSIPDPTKVVEKTASDPNAARQIPGIPQQAGIPGIPGGQGGVPAAGGGVAQPFHETNAFKIGFLVACIAVVIFWWRNRVG